MKHRTSICMLLLAILACSSGLTAATSLKTLDVAMAADPENKVNFWEARTTTTYDTSSDLLYLGSANVGNSDYSITKLSYNGDTGLIDRTPLAPLSVYSDANNNESDLITNLYSYNAIVWDMVHFVQGSTKYIAAIVKPSTDALPGGTNLIVVNVSDPKSMFVSGSAKSVESAGGTDSRFLKVAAGYLGSDGTKAIFYTAVADPTSREFDTSKATVGIRGWKIPTGSTTALTEVDLNGGSSGNGVSLGAGSFGSLIFSTKMRHLTVFKYTRLSSSLYVGGHMSDGTFGLGAFHLDGSDVLVSANGVNYGTLFSDATADPTDIYIQEASRIHNLDFMVTGSSNFMYGIIHSTARASERNKLFAVKISTKASSDLGKLYTTRLGFDYVARYGSETSFRRDSTTSTGYNSTEGLIGGAALPVPPTAIVTKIRTVSNKVYVSSFHATTGSELWVSSAVLSSSAIASWTPWVKVTDTNFSMINDFAINGSRIWAVKEGNKIYYDSNNAFNTAAPTSSRLDPKNSAQRMRLRQLGLYNDVARSFVMGSITPGLGDDALRVNDLNKKAVSQFANGNLSNGAIWDMCLIKNSDGKNDLFVVPHTEIGAGGSQTAGGRVMVKLAADGTVVVDSAEFHEGDFEDGDNGLSRVIKILGGTDPDGRKVLFAFVPQSSDNESSSPYFNESHVDSVIKVFDAATLANRNLDVQFHQSLVHSIANLNFAGIQCAFWDETTTTLFVGGEKGGGSDLGLSIFNFNRSDGVVLVNPTEGQLIDGNLGFQHVYQINALHTARASLLILNASDSPTAPGKIFALPIVRNGDNRGQIASAADYTAPTRSHGSTPTWSSSNGYATMCNVGGARPWSDQAFITDLRVYNKTVYVSVVNPIAVSGTPEGVFYTTAIVDSSDSENVVGWTPWKKYGGLAGGTQEIAIDLATGSLIAMDYDSPNSRAAAWAAAASAPALNQVGDALATSLVNGQGGAYTVNSYDITGPTSSATVLVGTGFGKVTLAHINYKDAYSSQDYNPVAGNHYGFKAYDNDPALMTLGPIYCSSVVSAKTGWIFVGGHTGLAVLRDGSTGRSWTSIPTDLGTSAGAAALKDQTWMVLGGITSPVRAILNMLASNDASQRVVVALTEKKLYGFTADLTEFADSFDTLDLFTAPIESFGNNTIDDNFTCLAPLHDGKGTFLVGTTRGLYSCRTSSNALTIDQEFTHNSASLGPISSIVVNAPGVRTARHTYQINAMSIKTVENTSMHFKASLDVNADGSVWTEGPTATLVRTLDGLFISVYDDGSSYYYTSAPNYGLSSELLTISNSSNGNTLVPSGLGIDGRGRIQPFTIANSDGSRIAIADGKVYIYAA